MISIIINGKILVANYILESKAYTFKILASNHIDTIEIVSHNIGIYAPNSALLVLNDGINIYPFATASGPKDKMILYCIKQKK